MVLPSSLGYPLKFSWDKYLFEISYRDFNFSDVPLLYVSESQDLNLNICTNIGVVTAPLVSAVVNMKTKKNPIFYFKL